MLQGIFCSRLNLHCVASFFARLLEEKPPDQFSMASLAVDPNAPAATTTDHYVSKRVRDAFFRKYCMQSGTVTQTFNGRRRKKC
jgi:hypothetical protein